MSPKKRNRFIFVKDDSHVNETQNEIQHNRIKKITLKGKKYLPIMITISVAIIAVGVILIITKYKKPQIFTPSELNQFISDSEKKDIPLIQTKNPALEKGKKNYFKGYYNNAISDFNNVIESDADDEEKAIALTYIGIIYDTRGNYNKAIEYYLRALKYDDNNTIIYRNLAIAYRHNKNFDTAIKAIEKCLAIDSKNINNRILFGNILFEQSKYKEAVNQYKEALKINPDDSTALHNLALALIKIGDELSGVEYFKKAGAADKFGKIASLSYSKLGVIYIGKKDYANAEKYLKMAVSVNSNDPVARYNLGIVYLKLNKTKKALSEFLRAEELAKQDQMLLENLGETYFSINEYDRSLNAFNKIFDTNRRNVKIISRIAEIYYNKGNLDKAFELYKRITTLEPASENARIAYLNMGNILDDAGRSDEAIEFYQKALFINQDDDSTLYNIGIAYKNAGKPELAIESWRKASELNFNNPKPLLAIADYYYKKDFFDSAIEVYHKILRKWNNIQEARFNLANIYYKKNLLDYAKEEYKMVIDLNNNNDLARKAYINLGIITSKVSNDNENALNEAITYIQKALLLKPGDAQALISIGLINIKKGNIDKAIEIFYQAISSSRNTMLIAEAYNNIGKCYYKKGIYKKALKAFTRGIEEEPTLEEIRLNRKVAMQAYEDELRR